MTVQIFLAFKHFIVLDLIIFLLSEHILCKESIVILKKFDFEILTHLYVLRSLEFICAIFMVMYVRVCLNTIASKWFIPLSSNLIRILQVTVGRTLLILVNVGCIVFLQKHKKEFLCITSYGVKFFKRL